MCQTHINKSEINIHSVTTKNQSYLEWLFIRILKSTRKSASTFWQSKICFNIHNQMSYNEYVFEV